MKISRWFMIGLLLTTMAFFWGCTSKGPNVNQKKTAVEEEWPLEKYKTAGLFAEKDGKVVYVMGDYIDGEEKYVVQKISNVILNKLEKDGWVFSEKTHPSPDYRINLTNGLHRFGTRMPPIGVIVNIYIESSIPGTMATVVKTIEEVPVGLRWVINYNS